MAKNDALEKEKTWPNFTLWGKECLAIDAIEKKDPSKVFGLEAGLYVIATPIGNLGDITLRALWALSQVDLVLCEDTRVSGKLLSCFGISKPLLSCHEHNEGHRQKDLFARLANGGSIALISDAGMPLIADPGYRLVSACRQAGHMVTVLPGASAAITAMASAGLPTDRFLFIGFLPNKKGARCKELKALQTTTATLIFYESPHRLAATLEDMATVFDPSRRVVIARELTKLHETHKSGTLAELSTYYKERNKPKGEIVLMLAPATQSKKMVNWPEILEKYLKTMSLRDAVAETANFTGATKKEVYQKALQLTQNAQND